MTRHATTVLVADQDGLPLISIGEPRMTVEPRERSREMRHPKYMPRDTHIGPRTVRFIPVKEGDVVELGDTAGLSSPNGWTRRTPHIILGFKPGTAAQPRGWLVVLVNEEAHPRSKPIKRREPQGRSLRAVS